MYQKIYDPILKSFIPIQSNYGIETLKNYIGGSNVKPRFEKKLISDFMKKIDPKTKNFPHYIKDNRCIPIYKKIQIPFEIKYIILMVVVFNIHFFKKYVYFILMFSI